MIGTMIYHLQLSVSKNTFFMLLPNLLITAFFPKKYYLVWVSDVITPAYYNDVQSKVENN